MLCNNNISQIIQRLNALQQEINSHTVAIGTQFKDINVMKKEIEIQIKYLNELSKSTYTSPGVIYSNEINELKKENKKLNRKISEFGDKTSFILLIIQVFIVIFIIKVFK